jgi:hypothetical protein
MLGCLSLRFLMQPFCYGVLRMTNMISAKDRMLTALKNGSTFTVNQARLRFGVKNVSQRIQELREEGWPIYTNVKSRFDGSRYNSYRMGSPNADMRRGIAMAYASARS